MFAQVFHLCRHFFLLRPILRSVAWKMNRLNPQAHRYKGKCLKPRPNCTMATVGCAFRIKSVIFYANDDEPVSTRNQWITQTHYSFSKILLLFGSISACNLCAKYHKSRHPHSKPFRFWNVNTTDGQLMAHVRSPHFIQWALSCIQIKLFSNRFTMKFFNEINLTIRSLYWISAERRANEIDIEFSPSEGHPSNRWPSTNTDLNLWLISTFTFKNHNKCTECRFQANS